MREELRKIRNYLFHLNDLAKDVDKKEQITELINYYRSIINDDLLDQVDTYEKLIDNKINLIDDKNYQTAIKAVRIKLLEKICSNPKLKEKLFQKDIAECIIFINEQGQILTSISDKKSSSALKETLTKSNLEFFTYSVKEIDFNAINEIINSGINLNLVDRLKGIKLLNFAIGNNNILGNDDESKEKMKIAYNLFVTARLYKTNQTDIPDPINYLLNQSEVKELWENFCNDVNKCNYDTYRHILLNCSLANYIKFMYFNF